MHDSSDPFGSRAAERRIARLPLAAEATSNRWTLPDIVLAIVVSAGLCLIAAIEFGGLDVAAL